MPHDYELLKNHISTAHPEILDVFVEGWNSLDPLTQARWRQKGFITPRKKVQTSGWLSWTAVRIDKLFELREQNFSTNTSLSTFEKRLAILFHNSIQHSGHLFGLPYMPPLKDRVYTSPDMENETSS